MEFGGVLIVVIVIVLFIIIPSLRICSEWERKVVLRLGRFGGPEWIGPLTELVERHATAGLAHSCMAQFCRSNVGPMR